MDNEENWKDCWKKPVKVQYREITKTEEIVTREGKLYGYAGKDVLIKGIKGEVYPCKIDIFKQTYTTEEPLSEERIRADALSVLGKKLPNTLVLACGENTLISTDLYRRLKAAPNSAEIKQQTTKQVFDELEKHGTYHVPVEDLEPFLKGIRSAKTEQDALKVMSHFLVVEFTDQKMQEFRKRFSGGGP